VTNTASPLLRAAFWMVGALFSFAAMAVAIRELSTDYNAFQILLFRSGIGLVVILAVASASRGGFGQLRSGQMKLQLFRNFIHYGGQWGWTVGIGLLPLATVFALEFTTPIWAAILAVLFLGEKLNQGRIIAILLGFAGILVIVRPGAEIVDLASLIVLGAAFCYAAAHTSTKRLTRTDTTLAVLFWMSLLQLPMGLVPAILDWTDPTLADVPAFIATGLAALSAHYCLTSALSLADATVVIPLDFLRLPLIAVVGALMYAESFDPFVLAGGALIFAGTWYALRYEKRKKAG